jgi:hypothetical protein
MATVTRAILNIIANDLVSHQVDGKACLLKRRDQQAQLRALSAVSSNRGTTTVEQSATAPMLLHARAVRTKRFCWDNQFRDMGEIQYCMSTRQLR